MKLIELHCGSEVYSLNTDYITGILNTGGRCKVYMVGDVSEEPWLCDESYEEVIRLIGEASNG